MVTVTLEQARTGLAELRADLAGAGASPRGGTPEAKALEARIYAELEHVTDAGVQVKGWAPLLLDWPGQRDGVPVLWCWLEGEARDRLVPPRGLRLPRPPPGDFLTPGRRVRPASPDSGGSGFRWRRG